MEYADLQEHVQALLDELDYRLKKEHPLVPFGLTEEETVAFLEKDMYRIRVAIHDCRRELEGAAELLRKNGFT